MKVNLIVIAMAATCVIGCNEAVHDESDDRIVPQQEQAHLKEVIDALSKDQFDCEFRLDHFSTIVRHLVTERNFGYKIDAQDQLKRARRDIQFVIDMCSIADSECARVLDAIESNLIAVEKCAAEQNYHGEYLVACRSRYERMRCQIEHASMAISVVRKAAFLYKKNRQLLKFEDGMIGFADPCVQEQWEEIIQALDSVQTLAIRCTGYTFWRGDYDRDYSNAVHRCEKRLERQN